MMKKTCKCTRPSHSACLRSRPFYDRRMGQEIEGEVMGDDYKGYIFKITGGNDKQGFAMKQGILVNGRARILFKKRKSRPAALSAALFFSI